jgi:DNA-binding LytR/AlgR family response regulator
MRVLIVDDERLARRRLFTLLRGLDEVEAIDEAATAADALERTAAFLPDVLLLDIHMPVCNGVELARQLPPSLNVVFVTADPAHALDAFELGAHDYLLKPVTLERLRTALARASTRKASPRTLLCRHRGGLRLFDASKIPRFHAADKYTVFTVDGEEFTLEESLDSLGGGLSHVRVHRSELVDLRAVVEFDGGELLLRDGQRVRVSRRRRAEVRRLIEARTEPP